MNHQFLSDIELTSFCLAEDLQYFIKDNFSDLPTDKKSDLVSALASELKHIFASHPAVTQWAKREPSFYKKLLSAWNNGSVRAQVKASPNLQIVHPGSSAAHLFDDRLLKSSASLDIQEFLDSSRNFINDTLGGKASAQKLAA